MYRGIAIAVLGIPLAGCTGMPETPPLVTYEHGGGYRYANLTDPAVNQGNSEDLFVILTLSGGGTRSAALAYGVMERLRDTRIVWHGQTRSLLDEVDVISGVSGGGFPGAYYAAFGDRLFDDFEDRFLYRNITRALKWEMLWPDWIPGPGYSRSDVAAGLYDREIFDDATYGDLLASGRRPFLVVNGTDMVTTSSFAFTQTLFDPICADLSGLSLGRAVAASSAFPFLLTPITLHNRAGTCDYPGPLVTASATDDTGRPLAISGHKRLVAAYSDAERRPYIHLLDGGVADYVGLRTALEELDARKSGWTLSSALRNGEITKLVVIAVDAWAETPPSDSNSLEPPGIIEAIKALAYRAIYHSRDPWSDFQNWLARTGYPETRPHTYFIRVGFDGIPEPARRDRFNGIATDFTLPAEDIDALRAIAGELLDGSLDFRRLVDELGSPSVAADFTLPAEDIDAPRAVAGELPDSSQDFRQLLEELRGPAVTAAWRVSAS